MRPSYRHQSSCLFLFAILACVVVRAEELTISIRDDSGTVVETATGDDFVYLASKRTYQEGDRISISGGRYLTVQVDEWVPQAEVYLPEAKMDFIIPFGEGEAADRQCWGMESFSGDAHIITARVTTTRRLRSYRNLALNPVANWRAATSYPFATASSVTKDRSVWSAKATIDGSIPFHHTYEGAKKSNHVHPNQAWGPEKLTRPSMQIDFGRPVEVDQVSLFLRDQMDHDKHWTEGKLVFSDGSTIPFDLDPNNPGAQEIVFPTKTISSVIIHDLDHPDVIGWSAMAEVQVFGRDRPQASDDGGPPPNFIVILTDDQGYSDLGCYGSETIRTPRIDQMAAEGIRLSSFYAAAPVCGPSRASLLTGCYSQRLAEPNNKKGLHTIIDDSEILISEILKNAGYTTGMIGKWHLAGSGKVAVSTDHSKSGLQRFSSVRESIMPIQKGFDSYFGIPYSNDMSPTVLMRGNEFVEELGVGEKQAGLTTRYTDEALQFVEANKDQPFFLYLAHAMPHKPLWPSRDFEGKSAGGIYGDCIEEIDWNTGRLLDKLKELGIDQNTCVIFTSDNGPYDSTGKKLSKSKQNPRWTTGGSAAPLRGYKLSSHEGGSRVPCVIRFPAKIKPGQVSDALVSGLDLFPTMARFARAEVPSDRVIDGRDLSEFLTGQSVASPRKDFYYYKWLHLHAVRAGDWKLVLPRESNPKDLGWYARAQEAVEETTLYDLKDDIGETTNLAQKYPEIVEQMQTNIAAAQSDLGDASRGIKSIGTRQVPD